MLAPETANKQAIDNGNSKAATPDGNEAPLRLSGPVDAKNRRSPSVCETLLVGTPDNREQARSGRRVFAHLCLSVRRA